MSDKENNGNWLRRQVEQAKQSRSHLAQSVPYLLPEYHNLVQAETELKKAQDKYDAALEKWQEVKNGE